MSHAVTTEQHLKRLLQRLNELHAWADAVTLPLPIGIFRDAAGQEWPIQEGSAWPSRAFPVSMRFEVTVPQAWAGQAVTAQLLPGGEGLLRVNGASVGGLNPFHTEIRVLAAAVGGEVLSLEIEASPKGLFGSPERKNALHRARLVVPDAGVRALYEDLLAVYDAAQHLLKAGRSAIAERLTDLLDAAFRQIPLERGNSAAYLARAVENPVLKATIDGLWDEYEFETANPPPYPQEWQPRLAAARAWLQSALDSLRAEYPAEGHLALTGHAHIDLAWLWPLSETRRKARRTFATVLNLMEQYPDFVFNQSMGQLYEYVQEDDPALFERIRARVMEGRWDVVGGMWVEPDGNLPSGEAWARQLLHGQRYFQKEFAVQSRVCWLPDTFGYAGNLPQLLRLADMPNFFTTKLNWNETTVFPYDLYHWEGLDGSRVLAHSFLNPAEGYNGDIKALDTFETWKAFRGKRRHGESLLSFGYGDGGGGPTSGMLERYARQRDFPGLPKLHMTRVADFYNQIGAEARANLPVWVGEQYFELHRGTYTTQAEIKRLNRRLELTLPEAEAACVLAARIITRSYPHAELHAAWKVLLRNQFHDILPGSSVQAVNTVAQAEMRGALEEAGQLRDAALQALSDAVGGPSDQTERVVVWNLTLQDRLLSADLAGLEGLSIPPGLTVPGLGYLSFPVAVAEPALPAFPPDDLTLENEYLRVQVSADGTLSSLYDKQQGREMLDGWGNQLWAYVDIPRMWEAWDVDATYTQEGEEWTALEAPRRVSAAEVQVRRGSQQERGNPRSMNPSTITQTYRLDPGSKRLDIHTHADWQGRRTFLRALVPLQVRANVATFETAFGAVTRPTHTNTAGDAAQFEKPGHRWADLSEGGSGEAGSGLSLLTDSKYGYSAAGNVLGLSLLRSPISPDPAADEGLHQFTYSLYPHAGDWRNGTVAEAHDLNAPLLAYRSATPDGTLPESARLLHLHGGPSLRLSALKLAEDSDAMIIRLYETHGTRGQATLTGLDSLGLGDGWQAVNLLEQALNTEDSAPQKALAFTPYQVLSLCSGGGEERRE
ncbi:glycoside hydrolase family 38 C-terminal domain-containing protein [Deinococcus sp. QL22]|uniref:alpha-mannosidase n=1 Tax=Deinococcus sp. QL22 TaxID=2939437 RepID=UPI00201745ED|nr:glycoside hydrolase family 38 C-terminal domain-containing protein [Deinococcus sp. QL22]UQN10014.1 glycosyl hydrolase-related protein [Deinococcus sp. QL22]